MINTGGDSTHLDQDEFMTQILETVGSTPLCIPNFDLIPQVGKVATKANDVDSPSVHAAPCEELYVCLQLQQAHCLVGYRIHCLGNAVTEREAVVWVQIFEHTGCASVCSARSAI